MRVGECDSSTLAGHLVVIVEPPRSGDSLHNEAGENRFHEMFWEVNVDGGI